MLWLSEVLLQHHELTSFDELVAVVRNGGGKNEMFFRMDVKPPFFDTPENWEEVLEASFTSRA
ncbi:MAG: sulfur relay protein DsrC [Gammaproteobacteria bacterium]|nr:sulfur relay protein DsrC [Gammaproteobacteria bacterium]MDX2487245.1 sulfur relay protein DsrC [Gammaproteobacteria bacterium]